MADQNLTHITIVADRSGSMRRIAADANGGIRQLLADQARLPGACEVSITVFDTEVEHPFTNVRPDDIKVDVIHPRGRTALNDAVGMSIVQLGDELAARDEDDRPGKVIFIIVTDGEENSSREYGHDQIKAMVTEQTTQWGWEFLFLGANIDAFAVGARYGFGRAQTINFEASDQGTESVLRAASAYATRSRSGLDTAFTQAERDAASGL